jgi:putative nucleotidyltransferase with HDIG domain
MSPSAADTKTASQTWLATRYRVADGRVDDNAVRLSDVLAGLSYALDLTEGQRPGHSVRSCLIGMRIAEVINLPRDARSALFYALLMKDLGCSSNAARFAALFGSNDHDLKTNLKHIDWSHALKSFQFVIRNAAPGASLLKRAWRVLAVLSNGPEGARSVVRTRCERGADIARQLGLSDATAEAIRALDEHWDGHGQPYRLSGDAIPLYARILGLAQTVEVFFTEYGVLTAYDMAIARRGTWFEPRLVDALLSIRTDVAFWRDLGSCDDLAALQLVEPRDRVMLADEDELDQIAEAFAWVIDAKSPWTYRHSHGVADMAMAIGRTLGLPLFELRALRRAALLHDLGKLSVSNLILDKPEKLTDAEFAVMRRHPHHTFEILNRLSCFRSLAEDASAHHERLDGGGYHRGCRATDLTRRARILSVADICDALRGSRPYRPGLPPERVLDIMDRQVGTALDAECVAAMRTVLLASPMPDPIEVPAARVVPTLVEDYQQAA